MADLFTGNDAPITIRDMAEECRREVTLRRRVYPRWVTAGKLKQGDADRRIAVMEAAADLLTMQASTGG
jgi:hypothetical protein